MEIFKNGEHMKTEEGSVAMRELNSSAFERRKAQVLKKENPNREISKRQISSLKKKQNDYRVVLSHRDLEVLEFIIDMKFASLAEVFEKFFSHVGSDQTVTSSTEWARKRLRQLEAAGLLGADYGIGLRERVYFATQKGYYAVNSISPEKMLVKPTGSLDLRTFVHDRELLLVRLEYERKYENLVWISDRKLRQGQGPKLGFSARYVPDALVEIPGLGNVALEIEIAIKSKARYRGKIQSYVRTIRESRNRTDGLQKVIFRCLKKACFEAIKSECAIYQEMFEVELVPTLSNKNGGAH